MNEHRIERCAVEKHYAELATRSWHCCECGWPNRPCLEMHGDLRAAKSVKRSWRRRDVLKENNVLAILTHEKLITCSHEDPATIL